MLFAACPHCHLLNAPILPFYPCSIILLGQLDLLLKFRACMEVVSFLQLQLQKRIHEISRVLFQNNSDLLDTSLPWVQYPESNTVSSKIQCPNCCLLSQHFSGSWTWSFGSCWSPSNPLWQYSPLVLPCISINVHFCPLEKLKCFYVIMQVGRKLNTS